jgi:hypothetical protein
VNTVLREDRVQWPALVLAISTVRSVTRVPVNILIKS